METKQLEIRDDGAHFSVIGILIGIGRNPLNQSGSPYERTILLTKIPSLETQTDPARWKDPTTMSRAHLFIQKNWKHIADGGVIDVREIRTTTHAEAA